MPIPVNQNHVSDRRGSAGTRTTDITPAQWPVITKSALRKMHTDLEGSDPRIRRLVLARIHLGQTMLTIDGALGDVNSGPHPNAKVYNALRSLRKVLEKELLRFPLEIRD